MRLLSDIELSKIKLLTENSVEFCLLEPTGNGLSKSIMDATNPVRTYLKSKSIHDYNLQKQGPEHKILISSFFIEQNNLAPTVASLYRPITKDGDPRIWFKGLPTYCNPNDILALLGFDNKLFVINVSALDIPNLLSSLSKNPLQELCKHLKNISNSVAFELISKMKEIAKRGPIASELKADTAIGRTLEQLLGIRTNSSKQPDYKGIELKAFRSEKKNRKNLFAQVPDWNISKFKSSEEILNNFGYNRGLDFKLYCTVSSICRNSQGLKLEIPKESKILFENSSKPGIGNFIGWNLDTLHKRLIEKHNETFWISADSKIVGGIEYFHYKKIEHTKSPMVPQFVLLIEQGVITLDHLIKRNQHGKVVEKGPLFKIKPNSVNLLFPPSNIYIL